MPSLEWLRYESKRAARNLLNGYYDSAISRLGIISQYLTYVLLRTNGTITIRYLGDVVDELNKLGGEDVRLRLLLKARTLTHQQFESLWAMTQFRVGHLPHLHQLPRFTGSRCLVDGMRSVRTYRSLLDDGDFVAKIPADLIPECVWGLWL